jgi:hypothetical protein
MNSAALRDTRKIISGMPFQEPLPLNPEGSRKQSCRTLDME